MRPTRKMASALFLALAAPVTVTGLSGPAQAQALRAMGGSVSDSLTVAMNRAIVVESEVPFAELSIANPGIADISTLSDRSIYVLGKAPGRTTLTILGANGELIANVDVHVSPDVAEFRERLRQILPSEPIEVRTANDGIVLSGTVSSVGRLDAALQLAERYAPGRISNLMTVGGTQQVMLRVRFSEVQRGVARELGGGVGFTATDGSGRLGQTTPAVGMAGVISGSFGIGGVQFQVMLEALESNGMSRTLAEPNLTALSGQEAGFLAGGEFPIPVVGDNGQITIEYRPFGVQLNFTPQVQDDGVINLQLNAAVSSVDQSNTVTANGLSVPAFRRRQTHTTVELRDGESLPSPGFCRTISRAAPRGCRGWATSRCWGRCSGRRTSSANSRNWWSSSPRIWSRRPAARP